MVSYLQSYFTTLQSALKHKFTRRLTQFKNRRVFSARRNSVRDHEVQRVDLGWKCIQRSKDLGEEQESAPRQLMNLWNCPAAADGNTF